MTEAGWPSAAARLTSRPSATSSSRRPSGSSYASTLRPDPPVHLDGGGGERDDVDLDVEVAGVGEHRAVLHHREVLGA